MEKLELISSKYYDALGNHAKGNNLSGLDKSRDTSSLLIQVLEFIRKLSYMENYSPIISSSRYSSILLFEYSNSLDDTVAFRIRLTYIDDSNGLSMIVNYKVINKYSNIPIPTMLIHMITTESNLIICDKLLRSELPSWKSNLDYQIPNINKWLWGYLFNNIGNNNLILIDIDSDKLGSRKIVIDNNLKVYSNVNSEPLFMMILVKRIEKFIEDGFLTISKSKFYELSNKIGYKKYVIHEPSMMFEGIYSIVDDDLSDSEIPVKLSNKTIEYYYNMKLDDNVMKSIIKNGNSIFRTI